LSFWPYSSQIEQFGSRRWGPEPGRSIMRTGKGRRWLRGLGLAGAVAALALAWAFLGRGGRAGPPPAQPERAAVAVTVEPVTVRPIGRAVRVVGSLYGRDEVAITPKVEGRVVRIHKDVGDVVRPGDLLLEIDPTDYRLAVTEARRALELELSKLGLNELPKG